MMTQKRPLPNDYAPYYGKYVMLVPDGNFLEILETQLQEMKQLLEPLTEQQADFRYAPGKWSIKETLGHVNDAERIFAVRILRIARGDQTPLPGFEQDDYVKASNAASRKLSDLLEEFSAVRRATIALIRSLDDASWLRRGNASGKEVSVLAIAFIIAGHALHHRNIFQEKYLSALPRA
ncbi:MAG TPA: DinB family protein [Candidatus Udaeobacter sp.]|nr:DinB family protein [Candidatus Udaeobacter sp.]